MATTRMRMRPTLLMAFGVCVVACHFGKPVCGGKGVVCTEAGTGLPGFLGEGGLADETELYAPVGLAFDRSGRLYVNDRNNLRIRRIERDGSLVTIAGVGYEGRVEDGVLAKEMALHHPFAIDIDAQDNLYIAGDHLPMVLRVGKDNRVTVVAGTDEEGFGGDGFPATMARLDSPCGVAVGRDGSLVIADTLNNRIRRVDPTGVITTIAGTGEEGDGGDGGDATRARLNNPHQVRLDAQERVLVADTRNHRIRRIRKDGIIETVAGNGDRGRGDEAINASESSLSLPHDVVPRPDGSFYVADTGNHRVRLVDANGTVRTVVGTGKAGYNGDGLPPLETQLNQPEGIAVDVNGDLWISDTLNHRVRRLSR